MQWASIKLAVYDRLKLDATPAAIDITRLERFGNRWHRRLLSGPLMATYRKTQDPALTSVADQWRYGTPILDIFHITERTNDLRLLKRSEEWWRRTYPDPTANTGTPRFWVPLGQTRITKRPANASELFVVSTSASDTNTCAAEIIRTDGHARSLSVTMTGTTAVSLDAAITDAIDVITWYLSAAAVGTVTLREDSGAGTVLGTIPIGDTFPRYTQIALAPTPSAALTYYVDGVARIADLSNDDDEPLFHEDFHDLITDGMVYEEWLRNGRLTEAQWLRDEIDKRVRELRHATYLRVLDEEEHEDSRRRLSTEDEFALPIT